jgi:hypothetical protein
MPKFGAHILIAEQAAQRSLEFGHPPLYAPGDPDERRAFLLGSIGPDLTLFLADPIRDELLFPYLEKFFRVLSHLSKAKDLIEEATKDVNEEKEKLLDLITLGIYPKIRDMSSLLLGAIVASIELGLMGPAVWKNIFKEVGIDIPGYDGDFIEAAPWPWRDPWGKVAEGVPLREFGHPYSPWAPREVGKYQAWWWMDILHYRRTGQFAQAMLRRSNPGVQRAYARGYFTHVAGDICGHPYVNSMVGGPFRLHAHRHMVLEGLMDTWLWSALGKGDIANARLNELIDVGGNIDFIAELIVHSMEEVYITPEREIHPSTEHYPYKTPTTENVVAAFAFLK